MFVDRAKILVRSGDGGKGCASFDRNRRFRHPRPDGGDGGDGGDCVFRTDSNIHTLLDFQFNRRFRAGSGGYGSGNNKKGKRGRDCIVKVPPGTNIRDAVSKALLRDLVLPGQEVVVCKGGKAGKGNGLFKEATPGEPGQERALFLELKLIADVGIIGYPNAGKSTLICRASRARPKVAKFPFTTTSPVLGIVELSDARRFLMAEIPGLIEGAHKGKGLGHEFLRHVERTHFLLHLVDMAAVEGRDPFGDYKSLNRELELYSATLTKKPQLIAANKMDVAKARENLKRFKARVGLEVFPISGLTGEGVSDLLEEVWRRLQTQKADGGE